MRMRRHIKIICHNGKDTKANTIPNRDTESPFVGLSRPRDVIREHPALGDALLGFETFQVVTSLNVQISSAHQHLALAL